MVERFSKCPELKEELLSKGELTQNKFNETLYHSLFWKSSDNNNIKIFHDGKFLHDNVFGFSVLDSFGFQKLSNRFYEMGGEYKQKYINDIINNMQIENFDYSNVLENLTHDYSSVVKKDMFNNVMIPFESMGVKYVKVPKNILESLSEFSGINIENWTIKDDEDNVKVNYRKLCDVMVKSKNILKYYVKKLFFSYISSETFNILLSIIREYDENFFKSNGNWDYTDDQHDIIVILSYDLNRIINLCKNRIKSLREIYSETGENKTEIEELFKVNEDETIEFSDGELRKRIKEDMEKSLEIYVKNYKNNLRIIDDNIKLEKTDKKNKIGKKVNKKSKRTESFSSSGGEED